MRGNRNPRYDARRDLAEPVTRSSTRLVDGGTIMEHQPVLPQMQLHVVDVLRQCGRIPQELHPLSFDGILGPVPTAHAKRNFALVVLELDETAMGRKRLSERLRNVLIR